MLAHKRKQLIKELVDKHRVVRVADLSEKFHISDVTIRRDLKELEEAGMLKRTHGGAIKVTNAAVEPSLHELQMVNVEQKIRIARAAYNMINDNDAIIIDSSATIAHIATFLKEGNKRNITLVTNSFRAVMDLVHCENVEIIHIGGQVRRNIVSSIGSIAENALKTLRVDKAFIGANGIDFKNGITTPNLFESQIKRAMMMSANETYVLAESAKFHQTYLSIICPVHAVDTIITDDGIDTETIRTASDMGVGLMVVGEND